MIVSVRAGPTIHDIVMTFMTIILSEIRTRKASQTEQSGATSATCDDHQRCNQLALCPLPLALESVCLEMNQLISIGYLPADWSRRDHSRQMQCRAGLVNEALCPRLARPGEEEFLLLRTPVDN